MPVKLIREIFREPAAVCNPMTADEASETPSRTPQDLLDAGFDEAEEQWARGHSVERTCHAVRNAIVVVDDTAQHATPLDRTNINQLLAPYR